MRRKTLTAVLITVLAMLGIGPASALATGGKSIATAPLVTYGQQEFGNTAEYPQTADDSCAGANSWRSYWNLPVTAGDLVTINWGATRTTELRLFPVGTTDYTLFQSEPVLKEIPTSNGKAQSQYLVPLTGTMPLLFGTCEFAGYTPGPYNFIVTAQHSVAVSLTPPSSTIQTNSVLTGTARLASGAAVPDGLVFTLSVVGQFGTATYTAAASGGALSFPLALPASAAGQSVTMTVSRPADAEYLEAKSSAATATVAAPSPAPAPATLNRVPHHRKPVRCSKHFTKQKVHGKVKCVKVEKKAHRREADSRRHHR